MADESAFPLYFQMVLKSSQAREQMRREVEGIGQDAQQSIQKAFGNIQQTIAQSLSIPRNQLGSLDLGATEFREAEKNARAYAAAAREVANASIQLARGGDENAAALRRGAQDALKLARGYEATAREAQQFADIQERVQAELNKTKSGVDAVIQAQQRGTTANGQVVNSTRAVRQATTQAGQQLQDIAISIGSGQRASTVFAQQLPQLAFAFSGVTGAAGSTLEKVGSVARFLAGPWGVLVAIGAFALGPLIDGLFKTEKGSDATGSATDRLANKLDLSKNSYETLIDVVNEYNKSQEKTEHLTYGAILAAQKLAESNLKAAKSTQALYDAEVLRGPTGPNGQGQFAASVISGQLTDKIRKLEGELSEAARAVSNSRVEQRLDPKIKIRADAGIEIDIFADKLKKNLITQKKYEDEKYRIEVASRSKIDALDKKSNKASDKKSNKASRSPVSDNGAPTPAEVSRILLREFGGTITSTNKGKHTVGSDHYRNQAVDFVPAGGVGAITKQQIEQALAYEGILIRISSKGKQLLGPGDQGHSKHFHVAFDKSRGDPNTTGKALEASNRAAEQLQQELDGIGLAVQRIGGEFDQQPRFIDRATLAAQKLGLIIGDIDAKLAGTDLGADQRAKLEADKAAAQVAQSNAKNAISNDFQKETDAFNQRLSIQKLILAGRTDEAIIAERIASLDDRYGTEDKLKSLREELRIAADILASTEATAVQRSAANETIKEAGAEYNEVAKTIEQIRRETTKQYFQELALNEAIEKRSQSIARYQNAASGVYGELEKLLSGGSANDFFKSIKSQFDQLRGANLAESLFGDSFRELKRFTERNNPENIAVRNLVDQIDTGSAAIYDFSTEIERATKRIAGAANDNQGNTPNSVLEGGADASTIVVTGRITKAIRDSNRYNFAQFAGATSRSIINPLLSKLDQTFGTSFFSQLSGVLSGALDGYLRAGKVGGALGGLKGIFDKLSDGADEGSKTRAALSQVADGLGKAVGGAQTGDQAAQILRSFGVKTSRTGGQIGGAIGSATGIPGGDIIGGIIGSVVGGLFKKTPRGSAIITSANNAATIGGTKAGVRDNLGTISGGLQDRLKQVAEAWAVSWARSAFRLASARIITAFPQVAPLR